MNQTANSQEKSPREIGTDIALIAGFAALIAVCALLPAIKLNGLVPVTLQTFGVMLAGAVLGAWRGAAAVALYVAVGAAGLPIFSGGKAGFAVLLGPTGGYLISFILGAALVGFIVERLPRKKMVEHFGFIFLAMMAVLVFVIHLIGPIWLSIAAQMDLGKAFVTDLAFYPGDIIKNVLAALMASAVLRAFPELLPKPRRQKKAE